MFDQKAVHTALKGQMERGIKQPSVDVTASILNLDTMRTSALCSNIQMVAQSMLAVSKKGGRRAKSTQSLLTCLDTKSCNDQKRSLQQYSDCEAQACRPSA